MDCKKIDPTKKIRVTIYFTPAGYCWFPVKDEVRGGNIFVGTQPEIAAKIKELNKKRDISV